MYANLVSATPTARTTLRKTRRWRAINNFHLSAEREREKHFFGANASQRGYIILSPRRGLSLWAPLPAHCGDTDIALAANAVCAPPFNKKNNATIKNPGCAPFPAPLSAFATRARDTQKAKSTDTQIILS